MYRSSSTSICFEVLLYILLLLYDTSTGKLRHSGSTKKRDNTNIDHMQVGTMLKVNVNVDHVAQIFMESWIVYAAAVELYYESTAVAVCRYYHTQQCYCSRLFPEFCFGWIRGRIIKPPQLVGWMDYTDINVDHLWFPAASFRRPSRGWWYGFVFLWYGRMVVHLMLKAWPDFFFGNQRREKCKHTHGLKQTLQYKLRQPQAGTGALIMPRTQ